MTDRIHATYLVEPAYDVRTLSGIAAAQAVVEPALSETIGATLVTALKEAADEAVRRGVPQGAAYDLMLGHLAIELAILFGALPSGRFSDGTKLAIAKAKPRQGRMARRHEARRSDGERQGNLRPEGSLIRAAAPFEPRHAGVT